MNPETATYNEEYFMTIAPLLRRTMDHALDYLASLDDRPIAPTASLVELRAAFVKPLPETGIPADQVIDALVNDVETGLLGSTSGRFFGWVIGGSSRPPLPPTG